MTTVDRIFRLIEDSKIQQKELAKFLNEPEYKLSEWKKGKTHSYTKYLQQIAEFFNVSVDYLLGKTDKKKAPLSEDSETENFVKRFKSLSPSAQQAIDNLMTELQAQQDGK